MIAFDVSYCRMFVPVRKDSREKKILERMRNRRRSKMSMNEKGRRKRKEKEAT